MWVAKIKYAAEKIGVLGKLAKKHNITLTGYPVSYSKTSKGVTSFLIGHVFGEEKNKRAFIREIKKSPLFISFEENNDFITATLRILPNAEGLYNPYIIYAKPAILLPDGTEILEVASFERKYLEKLISFLERKADGKLVSIKEEKLSGLSVVSLAPKITEKQKEAFELALNKGYYDYPRKIDIQQLAKISGINFSAYHAHLRKAEKSLLPYIYKFIW